MWYNPAKQPQNIRPMNPRDEQNDIGTKLHWLFLPGQSSSYALYDRIVEETDNFAVLPTKGSIVPGWVLVVPKFPIPRIADVPRALHGELNELVNRTCAKLEKAFGPTFTFEHGGFKGSQVSCGVDQAHLHIAALDFDLVQAAQMTSPTSWTNVDCDRAPNGTFSASEYWYVSSGAVSLSKPIEIAVPQFFRKIIAERAGCSEHWDYRKEDFIENVAVTLKAMGTNG